jgi:alkaline phosphatase D
MPVPPFLHPSASDPAPRRHFLRQAGATALLAAGASACRTPGAAIDGVDALFQHGVASGDPLADRIILWTRATPLQAGAIDIEVSWLLAHDPAMRRPVAGGRVRTGPQQDYTIKVDATGLTPGQTYYYRFSCGAVQSPVGRAKTLPGADAVQTRLAVFSCANYPAGYFNVYADAARQDDFDCAIHLGDYLYEYDRQGYANGKAAALGRLSEPANSLVVLADYRRRYAQYHTDPDLQALHASVPMIAVWDDHEFADDAWHGGAADHDSRRLGPFSARKAAAMRAWHEWMPVRSPEPGRLERIYRSFDFGTIASLHMLDTRIIGRDRQLDMDAYQDSDDQLDGERLRRDCGSPARRMMGAEQCDWLERRVAGSGAAWQILGQQVLMARMEYPQPVACGDMSCMDFASLKTRAQAAPLDLSQDQRAALASPTLPCYLDSWDGYGGERERVFDLIQRHGKNLVVLAGDTHNAWASDLRNVRNEQVGVEFATASVSSPGMEGSYRGQDPQAVARMMEQLIEPLYYAQTSKRGYMIVTATRAEVRCDWRFVDTVHSRQFSAATERSLRTLAGPGRRRLIEA